MKIGFDTSSLSNQHKVRGTGFYTKRLVEELQRYSQQHADFQLIEFSGKVPSQADIIHFPAFNPFFVSLPVHCKKPIVITIHDLIPLKFPRHFPPGLKGSLKWQLQKKLLKKTKAIITDSKASQKDIIKFADVGKRKVSVIYLAADQVFKPLVDKPWLEKIKNRYQLPDKFVLYVGDLNYNKNIPMLTRACLNLKYPLVVVGKQSISKEESPNHPETQDLINFQHLARQYPQLIIRLGFVPTKDLVGIYNLAAYLTQPSLAEGFGLPVLEAMACGCPVITSQSTSLSEISGKAAFLINPRKKQDLETALIKMWRQSGLRRRFSKLGLKQVKKFSWNKTAQQTLSVYQQIYQGL